MKKEAETAQTPAAVTDDSRLAEAGDGGDGEARWWSDLRMSDEMRLRHGFIDRRAYC